MPTGIAQRQKNSKINNTLLYIARYRVATKKIESRKTSTHTNILRQEQGQPIRPSYIAQQRELLKRKRIKTNQSNTK
jgi:hypothetical protein